MKKLGWAVLLILSISACDFDFDDDDDDKDDYEECMEKVGATPESCKDDD